MRALLICLMTIMFFIFTFDTAQAELHLRLTSDLQCIRLGQYTKLRLQIYGDEVNELLETSPEVSPPSLEPEKIKYHFDVQFKYTPKTKGAVAVGPYRIAFQNHALVSNTLTLQVLDALDSTAYSDIRVYPEEITMNEPVTVYIETQYSDKDKNPIENVSLKYNEDEWKKVNSGFMSRSWRHRDNNYYTYYLKYIILYPKKPGVLIITRDHFDNLKKSVAFTQQKVTVAPATE